MEKLINIIKQYFDTGSYSSEEAVRAQICYPILQNLGWDIYSPVHVAPEYRVDNLKADIALCHSPNEPVIFIEVKAPGKCSPQGQDQVFDYAARQGGIPMIIFTDGNEWHFYNSYGSGDYLSKKVKSIQLTKDDLNDCLIHFSRYLQFEHVKTEQAFENLRLDYERSRSANRAKSKIPEAWDQLVVNSDETLIKIIVDRVKLISDGRYTPKKEDVAEFLKGFGPENKTVKPIKPSQVTHTPQVTRRDSEREKVTYRFKINEQIKQGKNGKDVYVKVLDYVINNYGRFSELKDQKWNNTKSREFGSGYHISEHEKDVPKRAGHKTKLTQSGVWVNINLSASDMSIKLLAVGKFYYRVMNRKILDVWGSGAEVEFDIPTRISSS